MRVEVKETNRERTKNEKKEHGIYGRPEGQSNRDGDWQSSG